MGKPTTDTPRVVRAVTLPVREVVGDRGPHPVGAFTPLWGMATRLANWAQRELVRRDVRRTADMATLPAYDRAAVFGVVPRTSARKAKGDKPASKVGDPQEGSLYRLFCDEYPDRCEWDGAAASARDVLTAVEKGWTGHKTFGRFAVLWRGSARPCHFVYPQPYPVPSDKGKTLRLFRAEPDRPMASIPAPGEAEDRVLLRLADGREFRRQLRLYDYLRDHPDRLKQGRVKGLSASGRLYGAALVLVGSFDAADPRGDGPAATCTTGPGRLLTAVVGGDDGDPFVYHGDELPGVVALYDDWRHRFAVDMKYEKRWPADVRRRRVNGPRVQAKRDRARGRLRTARQTAAAQLVGWLTRRGVADLCYDDGDKSFLPRFDWSGLREVIRSKCQEAGIRFQHTPGVHDAA